MSLSDSRGLVPVQSYAARAARWAVLTPCCGPKWRQASFDVMLDRVRGLWHRRINSLADVLTDPIRADTEAGRVRAIYWKNCPPFGVVTPTTKVFCRRRTICPFCYGRDYILPTMKSCLDVLFKGELPLARLDDTVLVDFTTSIRFTSATDRNWQTKPDRVDAALRTVRGVIENNRRDEAGMITHLGGVVLQRVQFGVESWDLLRSGVFICNRRDYERRPLAEQTERERRRIDVTDPTRENLARAVGRAFRYPDTALVAAPEIVREYVQQLKQAHMLTRYGVLRGASDEI